MLAALLPLIAVAGWLTETSILTRLLPTLSPMVFNTALSLILAALAVPLSRRPERTRGETWAARIIACALILFGLVTLSQYLTGNDLGIDTFFIGPSPLQPMIFPGRASPQACANFILFGTSLLLFGRRSAPLILGQALAGAIAANAVIAMTGYLFSTSRHLGFPFTAPTIGLSIPSAFSFILLVFALFLNRPAEGMMRLLTSSTRSGATLRRVVATALLAPIIVGLLTRAGVYAGWYGVSTQISLFSFIVVGMILRSTWMACGTAEREELRNRTHSDQTSKLFRITRALSESLDLDEILAKTGPLLVPELADGCVLRLRAEDGRMKVALLSLRDEGKRPEVEEIVQIDESSSFSESRYLDLMKTGKPHVFRTGTEAPTHTNIVDSDLHRRTIALGFHSYLLVTVAAQGKAVGAMSFLFDRPSYELSDEDVAFFKSVAERVGLSIENARLYRSVKHAVKCREEILAVVSHDLKNPLAVISLSSQVLQSSGSRDEEKPRALLAAIDHATHQMQALISDLLDFSRLESGTFHVERVPEQLCEIVRSAADSFKAQADSKSQTLEVDCPNELPLASCDRRRVVQVLANLLGNAVKFTPPRERIQLRALRAGEFIEVSVSDTGPGIAPDQLQKIFERFWQAEETRHLGTGLGLTIAKGIVESHGGRIWAESQLGAGSTFRFTLPLARRNV